MNGSGGVNGTWAWLAQRITAVALVVILGIHLWVTHFADIGNKIVFGGVAMRLQTALFMIVDFSLLAFALYHGLNGLRNVIFDYGIGRKAEAAVTWVLVLVGAVAFVYGSFGLASFILARPGV